MTIPTDGLGIVILVVLVMPGVVYAGVRTWLRGYRWTDQSVGTRILDALLFSVILDSIYLAALGWVVYTFDSDPIAWALKNAQLVGVSILGLAVVVPGLLALLLHFRPRWVAPKGEHWPDFVKFPRRRTAFEHTPTAWDKAAPANADCFVRVQLPDGRFVAGWMSGASFVSTYPQSRDIYLQTQYFVHEDGSLGAQVPGSKGVWLAVPDGAIVEWFEVPPDLPEEAQHAE